MSLRVTLLASLPLIMLMCASGMAQPYQEAGGLVVVEGENYFTADGRTDENGYEWRVSTEHEGYVGAGYADTPGPQGTNGTWENACEITFDIEFTTPGTYSVWVRRYSLGGGQQLGLDRSRWRGQRRQRQHGGPQSVDLEEPGHARCHGRTACPQCAASRGGIQCRSNRLDHRRCLRSYRGGAC